MAGLAHTLVEPIREGPKPIRCRITTVHHANAPLAVRMRAHPDRLIPMEPHPKAHAMARVSTRQRHPCGTPLAAPAASTRYPIIARKPLSHLDRHGGGPPFAYPRSQHPPPSISEGEQQSQRRRGGRRNTPVLTLAPTEGTEPMSTNAVLTSSAQNYASHVTAWCVSRVSLLRAGGPGTLARSARHASARTARLLQIHRERVPGNSEGCWPFHACAICAPPTCAPSSSLSTAGLFLTQ